jgi:hypothetical protein
MGGVEFFEIGEQGYESGWSGCGPCSQEANGVGAGALLSESVATSSWALTLAQRITAASC